jgi:hypothetical protein
MVFNLLPDKRNTGLSLGGSGGGLEDGTDSAADSLQFREEDATPILMAMTGRGNTRGDEMNPVPGEEFPSQGGEDVMVGYSIDHEIPRIQMRAEVPERFFEMWPPLHE